MRNQKNLFVGALFLVWLALCALPRFADAQEKATPATVARFVAIISADDDIVDEVLASADEDNVSDIAGRFLKKIDETVHSYPEAHQFEIVFAGDCRGLHIVFVSFGHNTDEAVELFSKTFNEQFKGRIEQPQQPEKEHKRSSFSSRTVVER